MILEQKRKNGDWERVTEASFVMVWNRGIYLKVFRTLIFFMFQVARDPTNKKKGIINKLIIETEEEKAIFEKGMRNTKSRKEGVNDSLFKSTPTELEKNIIHDFFIKTVDHTALSFKARVKPENSVWMEDAKLKNLVLCQPEHKNRFYKIFGGFIMRQALELSWANVSKNQY